MDYLDGIGRGQIFRHDQELAACAREGLEQLKGLRVFGPKEGRAGVVSFLIKDVHAHDVVTLADRQGVALRGGQRIKLFLKFEKIAASLMILYSKIQLNCFPVYF
jgi:cysteine desulfurase/selenocysteine lyase